ncbi:tetratricopeptide repeat protein [Campylobacter mucosalis]|uniref:tetratricopeptide repeat protein n=1 Tax=Campylobacter mucosalis TaxID=202 RepID=UPI0014707842|nr:tetratricopeptide repeat protein [Campylobacter mucosalis]
MPLNSHKRFAFSLFVLFSTMLSASSIAEHFNAGNYAVSYEQLKKLMDNQDLNDDETFAFAKSAYETGHYDEALIAYEYLYNKDTKNPRIKLEIAQTFYAQGRLVEAAAVFDDVLKDESLPSDVRASVQSRYVDVLNSYKATQPEPSKHKFSGMLSAGYGYDSNAINTSDADYFYIIGLPEFPSKNEDKKSDHVAEYIATVTHGYQLTDSVSLDTKFVGYSQSYHDLKDKNLALAVVGSDISYAGDMYKFSFGGEYSYVWLDDKGYIKNYSLISELEYAFSKTLSNKIRLKGARKAYVKHDDKFKDAINVSLENSLMVGTKYFGVNVIGGVIGREAKLKGDKHHLVDYDYAGVKYQNIYPLTNLTSLISSFEYTKEKYKRADNGALRLYDTKREVNRREYGLGVMQQVTDNFSLGANFKYSNIGSNQTMYDYEKYTIKANFYYSF